MARIWASGRAIPQPHSTTLRRRAFEDFDRLGLTVSPSGQAERIHPQAPVVLACGQLRCGPCLAEAAMTTGPWVPSAAARRLFESAVVIDGLDTSNWGAEQIFRELRNGGGTACNAASAIWHNLKQTLDNLTTWLHWFEQYSAYIRPMHSVADIHAAKAEGRTGIILGCQNCHGDVKDNDYVWTGT